MGFFVQRFIFFLLVVFTAHPAFCDDLPTATHARLDLRGWTVWLNKSLNKEQPQKTRLALDLMDAQLKRVVEAVPPKALKHLREVPVWVNPQYENVRPRCEYHPGAGWLRDNGRDPRMEKAVEVTNVSNFEFENTRMPYLMLHELAHAYHDRVLGFDHPEIKAAFEAAEESGTYDKVTRFTGRKMVQDKAYAMSNHKEYFAENSEAYFGRNDFFPFNLSELKKHDPGVVPVLKRVWESPEE